MFQSKSPKCYKFYFLARPNDAMNSTDFDQKTYERRYALGYSSVRLVIKSRNLSPEQISAILDIEPSSVCRAGEDLVTSTKGEKYSSTIWSLYSDDFVKTEQMSQHLDWMMTKLSAKRTAFKHLRERKSKIRLECLANGFIPTSITEIKTDFLLLLSQSGISLRVASIFHADERESKLPNSERAFG